MRMPRPSLNTEETTVASRGFRRLALLGLVLGLGLMVVGCRPADEPAAGTVPVRPQRIRVGWSPSTEEPDRRVRFEGLRDYLAQRLGVEVELVETGTYSTQIEAFRARKIEVGSIAPFAYVIARDRAGNVEPLVVRGHSSGEQSSYRSVLIVPPDSPIRTIDDLKANARRLTLAWVDPASTSGHLIPRAYLESVGLDPDRDFKRTLFTMEHLASVMNVKSGKVDVAASMNTGLERMIERGRIRASDYRIIWQSGPIISDVTAVRSDLPEDFKEEIRRAYLEFPQQSPEVWSKFSQQLPDPSLVWVRAVDSDFDELRRIARSVKHLQLLEGQ